MSAFEPRREGVGEPFLKVWSRPVDSFFMSGVETGGSEALRVRIGLCSVRKNSAIDIGATRLDGDPKGSVNNVAEEGLVLKEASCDERRPLPRCSRM